MGAALYIILEKEISGVDTMIDGKMLSRAEDLLQREATSLGVRPLMEFFSMSPEEAADFLESDISEGEIPAQQWFSAEEGLRTVRALLSRIDASLEWSHAKDDLLAFERVLNEARKHGVRWHLAVDF